MAFMFIFFVIKRFLLVF